MHHGPQPRLPLDNRIRYPHLPAQRRQKDYQLDRIDIVGYEHQRGLLVLHQPHDVVEPVFHCVRLLAHIFLLLPFAHSRRFLEEPLFLLSFGLRAVFVEEPEGLGGGVAVESVGELGDGGRDFEPQVEDLLLTLQAHVFGPFHHARQIAARLDVLADAEVTRTFLDERVLVAPR